MALCPQIAAPEDVFAVVEYIDAVVHVVSAVVEIGVKTAITHAGLSYDTAACREFIGKFQALSECGDIGKIVALQDDVLAVC